MFLRAAMRLSNIHNLHDFEIRAKSALPKCLYSYINNGADDEVTLRRNRQAFEDYAFVPHMLRDVSGRKQSIELFGHRYDSPFGVSPVGMGAMYAFDGDVALARAAQQANIPYALSGASITRLEKVAQAAPNAWFQAYLPGDREGIIRLLQRAEQAGYRQLVITVDLPVGVNPDRYIRNGFSSPLRPSLGLAMQGIARPKWLVGTLLRTFKEGMPHLENWRAERGAPILSKNLQKDLKFRDNFNWGHIRMARDAWKGHLIIKGILSAEDAQQCVACGADGIIVSNHGGRQVDGAVSPLDVLPSIVACAGDLTVMMDSGIRRGSDVLKAIALGAKCVFAGRPFNYALACAGQQGVAHAIKILRDEVDRNLALLGLCHPYEMTAAHLLHKAAAWQEPVLPSEPGATTAAAQ